MTAKAKVLKIGDSLGVILSEEAMQELQVKEGEVLYLTKAAQESVPAASEDEEFERMMAIAKQGMIKYHDALVELAK